MGPLGTAVGPLPSLPLLGALPQHVAAFGLAGVLVPVLAGFGVGIALRLRGDAGPGAARLLGTALASGVTAGALLGLLSLAASGAIGPGRLAEVGPDALQVAWRAAVEVGIGALVGSGGRAAPGGAGGRPSDGRRRRPGSLPGCSRSSS